MLFIAHIKSKKWVIECLHENVLAQNISTIHKTWTHGTYSAKIKDKNKFVNNCIFMKDNKHV